MGTTTFGITNLSKWTGCSAYNSCTSNIYTLSSRTAKSRMITIQEATDLGCTTTAKSCPIWICNYLAKSASYGGTISDGAYTRYWLMNAYSDNRGYTIIEDGNVGDWYIGSPFGVRAVVVVNKA